MKICAVDSFRVFVDGEFVLYGPNRTASSYTRVSQIDISSAKEIEVRVVAYNTYCYSVDFQKAFFGVEILSNKDVVYNTQDFSC